MNPFVTFVSNLKLFFTHADIPVTVRLKTNNK